jgi:hypothetical protein
MLLKFSEYRIRDLAPTDAPAIARHADHPHISPLQNLVCGKVFSILSFLVPNGLWPEVQNADCPPKLSHFRFSSFGAFSGCFP